uniref:Putative sam-dependent methyltransferase/cell division protein ftsj n=1 Tax=Ixodes ricinus TaxID=34613 RepID=A0A0K8RLV4_IXORI
MSPCSCITPGSGAMACRSTAYDFHFIWIFGVTSQLSRQHLAPASWSGAQVHGFLDAWAELEARIALKTPVLTTRKDVKLLVDLQQLERATRSPTFFLR